MITSKTTQTDQGWLERVQIREAMREDLPGLEWDGEFTHFRRVYADAYLRSRQGLSQIWVAILPGWGIIGQVFIQLICDRPELADGKIRAYLYSFRVKPRFRSGGLGTHMMEIVEDDLRRQGFRYITLNVAKDNPRAEQLYQRRGYRRTAHEPGIWSYPDDKGIWRTVEEPAWRMEKCLTGDCQDGATRAAGV